MAVRTDALETALIELQDVKDIVAQSYQIRDTVLTRMQELRIACDGGNRYSKNTGCSQPTGICFSA